MSQYNPETALLLQGLFVHEASHTLQAQNGIIPGINLAIPHALAKLGIVDSFELYDYNDKLDSGVAFEDWNLEEQAAFFQDLYLHREFDANGELFSIRNGHHVPTLEELEAVDTSVYGVVSNKSSSDPSIAVDPDPFADPDDSGFVSSVTGGNSKNKSGLGGGSTAGLTYGTTFDPDKIPVDGGLKSPLILDLDGDGVEVAFGENIFFDMDDDGFLEQTSWAAADDGFLVIDRNADGSRGAGDGVIDQSNELVLSSLGQEGDTDLQALGRHDDNGDGVLDANDAIWNELKVWQDLDQDGETEGDASELKTLAEWGISEINLSYDDGTAFDDESNDVSVFGNTLHGPASFTMNGEVVIGGVGDLTLAYNTRGWREIDLLDGSGNVIGYSIEFEGWKRFDYAVATASTVADFDLTALNLDGATGDDRVNVLDATDHVKAVTISGGDGNDVITGGWDGDMITGDSGADQLRGGGGNDVVFFDADDTVVEGGEGYDVAFAVEEDELDEDGNVTTAASGVTMHLDTSGFEAAYGGDGDDTLDVADTTFGTALSINGGKGDDVLTSGAADDMLSGDEGDDTLSGNAGDDTLIGGAGEDTISGGAGADFILGGTGSDTLDAGDGDDFVLGGTGDDAIDGGAGDDYIDGGAGSDTIDAGSGDDFVIGGAGYDVIMSGSGDDYVDAGSGNDTLTDGLGDDVYKGGDGDDVLTMIVDQDGKDIFFGGKGNDTVKLVGLASEYTWTNLEQTNVTIWVDGEEVGSPGQGQYAITRAGAGSNSDFYLVVQNVENIEFDDQTINLADVDVNVDAESHSSHLTREMGDLEDDIDSNALLNVDTGAGDDIIDTSGHYVNNDIIYTGAGDDIVISDKGDDTIIAGSGNDVVYSGTYADTIQGGSGNDELVGGDGVDTIFGGEGNDIIIGDGSNSYSVSTRSAVPNDVTNVESNGKADTLHGGDGEDTILGGKGDDIIFGDDGADFVNAGIGDDTVQGGSGADQLYGGDGADTIDGGLGNDYIVADSGYSLNVTVHLLRYLIKGSESKSTSESRAEGIESGAYSARNLINDYLDEIYGMVDEDGNPVGEIGHSKYGTTSVNVIDPEFIDLTDLQFLTDILPRVYGRSASDDEKAFWQAKLDIGASYASIILEAIEQALVDPAKVQSTMVLFEEYTTAEAAALSFDDIVDGGAGDDQIYAGKGNDTVDGGIGHDKLHGGAGNDSLTGGEGSDNLLGGLGVDTLIGGLGADVLEGGHGADIIHGDNANNDGETNPFDTLSYEGSDEGVTIDLGAGTAAGGDAEGDIYDGVEWVAGSEQADDLTGDTGDNRLFGNGGDDSLSGSAGNDHLFGGAGDDTLNGGVGDDRLYGQGGEDLLRGGSGDDLLVGGDGNDIFFGGSGEDLLVGDDGADIFMLEGDGQDTVEDFTVGTDTIGLASGLSFADLTFTAAGINNIDTVVTFSNVATNGNASLYLSGVEVSELTTASVTGFETGTSGVDVLDQSGATHRVIVDALGGDDTITGSDHNDLLIDGAGNDHVSGGDGDDVYVYQAVDADDMVSTSNNGVEVDLTEVYRGKFRASQPSTHNDHTADLAIDGNTSTYNFVKNGSLTIDLKTDFELTRVVLDLRDSYTSRILGGTVQVLDKGQQVIESYEVTNLNDLDFAFSATQSARFVRVLPDDNGYRDYVHLDEIKIYGFDKFETDTITESNGIDTIRVEGISDAKDIGAKTVGNDLILTIGGDFGNTVTITDQWLDLNSPAVEFMELDNGDIIDMRVFHDQGGDDTLSGTTGSDTLNGFFGDDMIWGGDGNDTLNGGDGNDRITGGSGSDTLNGGDGDDYLADQWGAGTMDGGDGVDTVDVSHTSSNGDIDLVAGTVTWNGGSQTEIATNFENVVGSKGDNTITGTDGSNLIDGNDGNDTITGGKGRDTLMGGIGNDTYIYNLGDGSDRIIEGGFGSHMSTAYGSGSADGDDGRFGELHGEDYSPDPDQALSVSGGSDKIVFGAGIAQSDLTFTDIGDDLHIHLPDGATITIVGYASQRVESIQFNDGSTMSLPNRTTINWTGNSSGEDNYFSGDGNDNLNAIGGNDSVNGGGGNDTIDGGSGIDKLFGGSGNDVIEGGGGADTLYGDSGDDHISGGNGTDYLDGGSGIDTADYSYKEDLGIALDLHTGLATWGNGDTETVKNFENAIGTGSDDTIIGTNDANEIDGGGGNDIIEASAGDDLLSGGTGANTYVFSRGDGADTITDFNSNSDTIRIEGGAAANITIVYNPMSYNGVGVLITYGRDADGNPVDQIFLDGVPESEFGILDILTDAHEVNGSASADVIVATDDHEQINANAGDDDITAGGGNDDIDAGAGDDVVHAGSGNDKVIGGTGADTVYLGQGNDIFVDDAETGTSGSDTVHGDDGDDIFFGDGGDDTFYGDAGSDTLYGGDGNDTLVGDSGITDGKLIASYYRMSNAVNSVDDIPRSVDPDGVGIVGDLDVNALATGLGGSGDHYGIRYVGTIVVTVAGDYTFETGSDDGSNLLIDDDEVVDNDGLHGLVYQNGTVHLEPGTYEIEVNFFDNAVSDTLEVTVQGPDTGDVEQDIFASGMLGDAAASTSAPTGFGLEDVLNGGAGNDILTGGSGADIIELDFGSGNDTMTDFEDGVDLIDLSATGLGFGDLVIVDTGTGDTRISFDDGDGSTPLDELVLTGIVASSITAADFQFT